ncbi:S-phase kinase-associated protein [Trypanosoma rangeli]|uniref:S-phase kinase-associated protein n=1 Tax=Trypanosoma rangeli TaxID=5698 RepID=A0A422NRM4_TRYRA|nr:S-phase kinase-associated protein [Trypanosoma rangeli]RNF08069.1 S-phase kinase-associated protein [Trypanosoma rangeli]|eukprot:RNF08069.1 S-phase kinase-associated protein [Trypanosoma rangeli]
MPEEGGSNEVDFTKYCVLQSNDQPPEELKILREAAMMSGLLKDMLDDQGDMEPIIPIPNVSGRTLRLVIEYMEHHYQNRAEPIEKPLKSKIDTIISPWDHDFLFTHLVKNHDEKQHEVLIDVIMAANFLNIKDLLDLTCACVASMIRGKTAEQIRALFNIESDFTPEEEEKIREENRWCEEA